MRSFVNGPLDEMQLDRSDRILDLSQPRIMGVLNVTPDSFSDGGRFDDLRQAVDHALAMIDAGAAVIDVGGESTRPGADPVSVDEELRRVIPVIERLRVDTGAVVSIDTMKPAVMRRAVAAGAGLINDVNALRAPGALEAAVDTGVSVCLMHMQGEPGTMQRDPRYDDVVAEVSRFLLERARVCREYGIAARRIILDPGFGFGKTLAHNLRLFAHLREVCALGYPVLVGVSRKSMIGGLMGGNVSQRLHGSVAAAALAVWEGVALVRTHDVAETREALTLAAALRAQRLAADG